MKTKNVHITSLYRKLFMIIPVVLIALIAFSSCAARKKAAKTQTEIVPPPPPPKEVVQEAEPEPFVVVEQMPVYPGGDTELLKYIAMNTRYPEKAKANNIQVLPRKVT
jgi:hypothetical protein